MISYLLVAMKSDKKDAQTISEKDAVMRLQVGRANRAQLCKPGSLGAGISP